MQNRNNNTAPATANSNDSKGEAVYEPTHGKVRGSVWKNFSQNTGRHYYKVSIRRVETDTDGREYLANSFWPEDLTHLASVATSCRIWLQDNTDAFEQQREWRKSKVKRSKNRKAPKAESPDSIE